MDVTSDHVRGAGAGKDEPSSSLHSNAAQYVEGRREVDRAPLAALLLRQYWIAAPPRVGRAGSERVRGHEVALFVPNGDPIHGSQAP